MEHHRAWSMSEMLKMDQRVDETASLIIMCYWIIRVKFIMHISMSE